MPIQQIETDVRKLDIAKKQIASGATSVNIGGKQYKVRDARGDYTPVVKRVLSITPAPQGQPTMGTVSSLSRQLPTTGVTSPVQDTSVQAPPIQGQTPPRTLPFTAPQAPAQPQVMNVPTEGKTPSQFQQAFEAVMKDSMAKANAPYVQGGSDAMSQLLTTTENLPSMEGWAGATTSQKERMAQLERSGLSNMYEGYATALENKQTRMKDLLDTATGVFTETLNAKDKQQQQDMAIVQLQYAVPEGEKFMVGGKEYIGKASSEATGWDHVSGTENQPAGKFNKTTGEFVPDQPSSSSGSANWTDWVSTTGSGKITQSFNTPAGYFKDGRTIHGGYDIDGEIGDAVYSPVAGTVIKITQAGKEDGGWGNSVVIQDASGNVYRMSHFDSLNLKEGDTVNGGSYVGALGNTGHVIAEGGGDGSHLHIEGHDSQGNLIDIAKTFVGDGGNADNFSSALKKVPKDLRTAVITKANQFDNEQQVKNFQITQEGWSFVQSISDDTTNPADNQGLIYSFAKMMDPDSVVREGEYATVQKYSQSWLENFGFNALRVVNNQEFLTKGAIKNMKETLKLKYNASEKSYDKIKSEYIKILNNIAGVDIGENLLQNYKTETETTKPTSVTSGQLFNILGKALGTSNGQVTVVSPDGIEGTIPADQLQEALKEGYKQK